jgi:hypothetical protein
MPVAYYRT